MFSSKLSGTGVHQQGRVKRPQESIAYYHDDGAMWADMKAAEWRTPSLQFSKSNLKQNCFQQQNILLEIGAVLLHPI